MGYACGTEDVRRGSGTARAEYTRADSLIAQTRGGRISYYLYDGHGDVRALLDEAGAVTDRYRYSAYGELTEKTGNAQKPKKPAPAVKPRRSTHMTRPTAL